MRTLHLGERELHLRGVRGLFEHRARNEDSSSRLRWRLTGVPALIGAGAVVLPLAITTNAWRQVFVLMVIYAGLATGLNILVGFTGLLDLGFVAFFAVGAYMSALVTTRVIVGHFGIAVYARDFWWIPYVVVVPAIAFAGLLAALVGYPTLRARGDYLAIMTLALGEIVQLVARNWVSFTNGSIGISNIPPFALSGIRFYDPLSVYFVALILTVPCIWFAWRISRSHLGRVWRTIRADELVAESIGVRVPRYKLYSYVAGGAVAGLVGVIYANSQGFIDPTTFTITVNFVVLSVIIIGGTGSVSGPILGAVAWVGGSYWLSTTQFVQSNPEMGPFILSALVLGMLVVRPSGIISRERIQRGRSTRAVVLGETNGHVEAVGSITERLHERGVQGRTNQTDVLQTDVGRASDGGRWLVGRGLQCSFGGVHALDGVDIEIRSDEILGLIGPNGAGKTTLVNVLTGVQRPQSGVIALGDREVKLSRPSVAAQLGISRTFQLIRVLPEMSVLENVVVGAHIEVKPGLGLVLGSVKRSRDVEHASRAMSILRMLGLESRSADPAGALPYADQRRIEIARALMPSPHTLFLDEPAAGMSDEETQDLGVLIGEIWRRGIAVCLIEHDVSLVTTVCHRVVAMDRGKVVADGSPGEVIATPTVASVYLGTAP